MSLGYLRRDPDPDYWPYVLKYRDLHAQRIPELVSKLGEIPLKRTDVEASERNQVGLALKNPDD